MRSSQIVIAALVVAVAVALGAGTGAGLSPSSRLAAAQDTCTQGYVWREAFEGDTVCVTPETRSQTLADNAEAAARREPGGGAFGPNTCKQGYVWRVARPDDLVCVTPEERDRVAADNAQAAARGAAADPGTHILALEVGPSRWVAGLKEFGDIFSTCDAHLVPERSHGRVGWGQNEEICTFAYVAQRAVHFDTAPLDRIPEKRIDRAALTYDEAQGCWDPPPTTIPEGAQVGPPVECWQNGRGTPEDKPNGCVVVRVPSQDWTAGSGGALIPYISHPSGSPTVTRLRARGWDVTEPYRWQTVPGAMPLQAPGSPPLSKGFGFLLTGEITSLDQLTGDDSTFCLSTVSNIRLYVTYTVTPGGQGPIVR
jgi:hypothetical protein